MNKQIIIQDEWIEYLFNYLEYSIYKWKKNRKLFEYYKNKFLKNISSTINYCGIVNFFSVFQNLKTFLQRFFRIIIKCLVSWIFFSIMPSSRTIYFDIILCFCIYSMMHIFIQWRIVRSVPQISTRFSRIIANVKR